MHKRNMLAIYRLLFGLLGLSAIVAQFIAGLQKPGFIPANFFSFFTIESNILAAIILIVAAIMTWRGGHGESLAILRGAATLYMLVTGIVYVLLLAGLEASLQTTIPWVNAVLHYIMPIAVLIDWAIDIPKRRMQFKRALFWISFPAIYLIYTLARGHFIGWYPYPFLNPANGGYISVLLTSIGILLAMLALIWLVTLSTRLSSKLPK